MLRAGQLLLLTYFCIQMSLYLLYKFTENHVFHVVNVRVAECEFGAPSCPSCTGRSSEEDVNNCPKQQCNSTLVCRLSYSLCVGIVFYFRRPGKKWTLISWLSTTVLPSCTCSIRLQFAFFSCRFSLASAMHMRELPISSVSVCLSVSYTMLLRQK